MKKQSFFFIGLALFAMFFGSGNLTFPLFIGQFYGKEWVGAGIGFLLSATLLPFLGILSMIFFKGNAVQFFQRCGKFLGGKYLIPIFLTVWIPLGSAPRCISVAYAGISNIIGHCPLWLFSAVYSLLIFFVTYKKHRLLNIMGYVLTPLLLLGILSLFIKSFFIPADMISLHHPGMIVSQGLLDGYNTMDLIASCFFSASVIQLLKTEKPANCPTSHTHKIVKLFLKASFVGISILGMVYLGMMHMAAKYSHILQSLDKEQILPHLVQLLLGPKCSMIASIIILLACITTSAALLLVYTDYLKSLPIQKLKNSNTASIITLGITFCLSLLGFSGIITLSAPLLQILYPVLIVMVAISLISAVKAFWKTRKERQHLAVNEEL